MAHATFASIRRLIDEVDKLLPDHGPELVLRAIEAIVQDFVGRRREDLRDSDEVGALVEQLSPFVDASFSFCCDFSPLPVLLLDADGTLIQRSQVAADWIGLPESGGSFADLLADEDSQRAWRDLLPAKHENVVAGLSVDGLNRTERPLALALRDRVIPTYAWVSTVPCAGGRAFLVVLLAADAAPNEGRFLEQVFRGASTLIEIRAVDDDGETRRITASDRFLEWFPYVDAATPLEPMLSKDLQVNSLDWADLFMLRREGGDGPLGASEGPPYSPNRVLKYPIHQRGKLQTGHRTGGRNRCFKYWIHELDLAGSKYEVHWLQDITREWYTIREYEQSKRVAKELLKNILRGSEEKYPAWVSFEPRPFNGVVGGDFFWQRPFEHKSENRLLLIVGDVSGHDLTSALMAGMLGSYLDDILDRLSDDKKTLTPNRVALALQNRLQQLLKHRTAESWYLLQPLSQLDLAVLIFEVPNSGDRRLQVLHSSTIPMLRVSDRATHPPKVTSLPTVASKEELGSPVGDLNLTDFPRPPSYFWIGHPEFEDRPERRDWRKAREGRKRHIAELAPQDLLVIATDGLTKQHTNSAESGDAGERPLFGIDGLAQSLRDHGGLSAPECVKEVLQAWDKARGDLRPEDDVLLVAVDVERLLDELARTKVGGV